MRWKLTLKNYNCATHLKHYQERGWTPDCRKPNGRCRIGIHLATDPALNDLINEYLVFKRLPAVERSPSLADQLLKNMGLLDHPDLLIRLEIVYHDVQATEVENDRIKRKHHELARRNK